MAKLIAYKLKSGTTIWWDQIQRTKARQGRELVHSWRRMKYLLMERFLLADYEQHLFQLHLNCLQGERTVHDYTTKFIRLVARNNLMEAEEQKVAQYLNELKASIRDKIGLQIICTLEQAQNLALKAQVLEKRASNSGFYHRYQSGPQQSVDMGKTTQSATPAAQLKEQPQQNNSRSSATMPQPGNSELVSNRVARCALAHKLTQGDFTRTQAMCTCSCKVIALSRSSSRKVNTPVGKLVRKKTPSIFGGILTWTKASLIRTVQEAILKIFP